LQAGDQGLLMAPGLGAGPLREPGHGVAQGGRVGRAGQVTSASGPG
jgi:hypothetical protein